MKKRNIIFSFLTVFSMVVGISVSACSCKADEPKETPHEAKTEWVSDESKHWHECKNETCDEKFDEASHTFTDWKLEKEPTCEEAGIKYKVCTVCNYKVTETIAALGHKPKTAWVSDDTSHWHECENCDAKVEEAAHTYGEWEETKSPTCAEKGLKERTCKVCGHKEKAEIPVLEHKPDSIWHTDETSHWHKCSHEGCNEQFDKAAHTYGEWEVVKAATCEATGLKRRTCTVCGYTNDEIIPIVDHEYLEEWKSNNSEHWKECTKCGHKDNVASHTFGEWTIDIEPTCTENGLKKRTCSVCGYVESEVIQKTGHEILTDWTYDEAGHWHKCAHEGCASKNDYSEHTYGDWTITKAATCTEDGSKERTCSVCGYKEVVAIPKLEHDVNPIWLQNETHHWHTCKRDGCTEKVDFTEHSFNEWTITKAATCTEKGSRERTCTVCGYKAVEEIEALGHNMSSDWITNETHHWHECTNDGCTEKFGLSTHTFGKPVVTPATCTEKGSIVKTCQICGYQDIEEIPALGHDMNPEWKSDETSHWHGCNNEGCNLRLDEANHTYGETVVTPATCTTDGSEVRTCTVCGYKDIKILPAFGHSIQTEWTTDETHHWHGCHNEGCDLRADEGEHTFSDWVETPPTCTEKGSREKTCTVCGYKVVEEIPALGHDLVEGWKTDGLYHWHVCKRDNCIEYLDKGLHTFGDLIVDKAPTCTTSGRGHKFCTVCNQRIDLEIPPDKTKHTSFEPVVLVNPTADSDGYVLQRCSDCGDEYRYRLPNIVYSLYTEFIHVTTCDVNRNAIGKYNIERLTKPNYGPLADVEGFLKDAIFKKLNEETINFKFPQLTFKIEYNIYQKNYNFDVNYPGVGTSSSSINFTDLSNTDVFRAVEGTGGTEYYLTENFVRTSGILDGDLANNEYIVQEILKTKIKTP